MRYTLSFLLVWGLSSCTLDSADLQPDQWNVINYWAIWCKPCREEIPELNRLDQEADITYYDFYVFQYATSIAAASNLAKKIRSGNQKAQQNFINLLKAGGSDYPYKLMKNAGIDMATPAPYRALVERMNAIMDEMEVILDKG